eukprot:gene7835-9343_t
MTTVAAVPVTKPASQRAAPAGIYIPKAKREQMEKEAAAAAAAKPTEPVKANPIVKVPVLEKPKVTQIGNKGTVKAQATTAQDLSGSCPKASNDTPKIPQVSENSEECSSFAVNTKAKSKEVVRGAVYVPKGRRELNEKKAVDLPLPPTESADLNDGTSTSAKLTSAPVPNSGFSVGVSLPSQKVKVVDSSSRTSPPRSKTYSSWDDSSEDETTSSSNAKAPTPVVSVEDTIQQCTLVLSGVPTDMSELARSNITRAYADKGATIKWTSNNECLLMFKTEKAAMQMVPSSGASIFRVIRLQDMSGALKEDLVSAARENFVITKPERDSTVANRLIGAALGIRLPKNLTSSASAAAKRAPSPVREDAWDD